MKNFKIKLLGILKERRGESLMETIIAVMLFSVLIISVTTMVTSSTSSLRTTQRETAAIAQTVNAMNARTLTETATEIEITLRDSTKPDPAATAVSVSDSGVTMSENDLLYFYINP